jgi:hypothetical protein
LFYLRLRLEIDSSVGTAMYYELDGQGSIPGREKIFLFSIPSRPLLGPIQWLPEVKRQGHEADHSPQSSVVVKIGGVLTPLPYESSRHSVKLVQHRLNSSVCLYLKTVIHLMGLLGHGTNLVVPVSRSTTFNLIK